LLASISVDDVWELNTRSERFTSQVEFDKMKDILAEEITVQMGR
jgi:hypothetical protein